MTGRVENNIKKEREKVNGFNPSSEYNINRQIKLYLKKTLSW